jgi:hypothetical protein
MLSDGHQVIEPEVAYCFVCGTGRALPHHPIDHCSWAEWSKQLVPLATYQGDMTLLLAVPRRVIASELPLLT